MEEGIIFPEKILKKLNIGYLYALSDLIMIKLKEKSLVNVIPLLLIKNPSILILGNKTFLKQYLKFKKCYKNISMGIFQKDLENQIKNFESRLNSEAKLLLEVL